MPARWLEIESQEQGWLPATFMERGTWDREVKTIEPEEVEPDDERDRR